MSGHIIHTDPRKISEIFWSEKNILYHVPKYQREYIWWKNEWEALFNDIIENWEWYFLGSVICVNKWDSAFNSPKLEVIDGQQRITSLSLLLLAIYVKIKESEMFFWDNEEDWKNELYNIWKEIIVKDNNTRIARITPQVQHDNRDDYFSLLAKKWLLQDYEEKRNAWNRRIYKAYNYFSNAIDKYVEENGWWNDIPKKITILFDLAHKFNSAIIVSIEVWTNSDAYMLFTSLNNRGKPLSAIDLIKNSLVSASDQNNESESAYSKWKKILWYLWDDDSWDNYAIQERFFRQFYNTYRDELNENFSDEKKWKIIYPLWYLATRTTLLNIYEKLIKKDYNKLLDRLENESRIYSILINNASQEDIIEELEDPLLDLERIWGAPSYILLMYLLSNKDNMELDCEILWDIIKLLTRFFVRRNITDFPNTRNLTKIFMDLVSSCKDIHWSKVYTTIYNYLKENSSSDDTFKEKLGWSLYLDNPDATRFLLCYYENQFKTNEIYTDLRIRDNNKKYIRTIEHIFPEWENIPSDWVKMIADWDKQLASFYLDRYAHTLGNLTITWYNQNLSNKPFEEKRDRKNSKWNYIWYRNGLKLNEDVVNQDKWKIENIKARTEKLVEWFVKEFKL